MLGMSKLIPILLRLLPELVEDLNDFADEHGLSRNAAAPMLMRKAPRAEADAGHWARGANR